jgi:Domain of unknown function (DUF5597)/Glycosyl hydrolases family 35
MFRFFKTAALAAALGCCLAAAPLPQIVKQGRKFTLMVDGKPFIMLGGQVNNSSGWPSRMQEIWPVFKALSANTAEIPVYWETVEPKPGEFRFEAVDQIIRDARVQNMRLILLWFATCIYVMDYASYRKVCKSYSRPDNALLIPETGGFGAFARYMFYALADYDSLGFAPFGIDRISAAIVPEGIPGVSAGTSLMDLVRPMMDNYRLLAPALDQIAAWQGTGKLRSAVEEDQITERLLNFTDYEVLAQFGRPQVSYGGTFASGTEKKSGRSMIAEIAPDEFVIIGFDTRVRFEPRRGSKLRNAQFLWVEEGKFENGVWKPARRLNGDENFFGLSLPASGAILRAKLMSY